MYVQLPTNRDYLINDNGEVVSLKYGKWRKLKTRIDRLGYIRVGLTNQNKQRSWLVHRLVMLAFVGASDAEINHINGDKTDNTLVNLEYSNRSDNIKHAYYNKLLTARNGERASNKLKEGDVQQIRQMLKQGYTMKWIGNKFKITAAAVWSIKHGKLWKCLPE